MSGGPRLRIQGKVLSEHPIDSVIRRRIMQTLAEIEAAHEVTVLYACESGSRGWGFASPDSDYDVRFIYVHRLSWYLRVVPGRDVIERPINDVLDVSGWELRKALGLLRRLNPTLFEWFDSPVVYQQNTAWRNEFETLASAWFAPIPVFHHYLSTARKNFADHLHGQAAQQKVRLKKYLYVLRPLLAAEWVRRRQARPPMRFADLVADVVGDADLLDEINALLAVKMQMGEAEYGQRWPRIDAFIEARLAAPPPVLAEITAGDTALLDAFLLRSVQAATP